MTMITELTVADITRALSEPRTISGKQHLMTRFGLSPLLADEWLRRQRSWVGHQRSKAKRAQGRAEAAYVRWAKGV